MQDLNTSLKIKEDEWKVEASIQDNGFTLIDYPPPRNIHKRYYLCPIDGKMHTWENINDYMHEKKVNASSQHNGIQNFLSQKTFTKGVF